MQHIDLWESTLTASGYAEGTIAIWTSVLRNLTRSSGRHCPTALTRHDTIEFLARPHLSPATRRTYWTAVRNWIIHAQAFGLPVTDLLAGVRRPPVPRSVARPIPDAHVRALLALDGLHPRTHAYIRLALLQALRVSEIARVRGDDFVDGWMTVYGKGGINERIPIHPEVEALRPRFPAAGPWFPTSHGVVNPHTVSKAIRTALRKIGSDANPHRLRDSAATMLQRQGHDLRVTQAFLRHVSVTSTQKYTRVADEQLIAATGLLDWAA